mmetsp:Transcript_17871/g.21861  ORF Transcript_17871/g.21861 Transcript_17871/m.21861 type:complete len:81 (+) Transcript_17871:146-388(+)
MYLHSGKWLSKQGTAFTTPTGYVDVNSKWKEIIDCSYTLLHMFHRHKLDGQTALWLSSLDPPTSVPKDALEWLRKEKYAQ